MSRRYGMTLYCDYQDIASHQVRMVLWEKGVNHNVDIVWINEETPAKTLLEVNPEGALPTLVDRELVLYRTPIILEYLEERFPHPPLLPVYPVARAKSRLMMFRIEQDWYRLLYKIQQLENPKLIKKAREQLLEYFVMLAPVFEENAFFLSNELTLVDCYIAPLLWRLPSLGISLPPQAKSVISYAKRIFERSAFKQSLSEVERELQEKEVA